MDNIHVSRRPGGWGLFATIGIAVIGSIVTPSPAHAAEKPPLPGQIIIDPERPQWLKRHGGKHVFICGPGDPEEFLYLGSRNRDGTRAGPQLELIDKLAAHGGNCIYMQIVRTHGGDAKDDRTHNPFVDSDPAKGLDRRILDQWEQWFARMDQHGILIYLFFYDDSARIWNTGDVVGPEERAFVEGIVNRFEHHRNLIWVFGEESEERYTTARVQAVARVIRDADAHGHIIGDHHLSGSTFKAWQPGGAITHFSMQLRATDDAAHAGAVEALENAAGRYQVIFSESTAMRTDVDGMRRHAWAVAMGGVMPMLLRMDIATTPVAALEQCRHLQKFFEQAEFFTLSPHDELKHDETRFVLAEPGRSYLAYAYELQNALGLRALPAGRCEVTWLDCRSGKSATDQQTFPAAGDRRFRKPAGFGDECAAWIRFPDVAARAPVARSGNGATPGAARVNQPPVIADREIATRPGVATYVQLAFTDEDGPGPYAYTIVRPPAHGTLTGSDNDRTYTPRAGFAGEDSFTWRVSDGRAESKVGTIRIRVAPSVK